MCKKNFTPQPSGIYPKDTRLSTFEKSVNVSNHINRLMTKNHTIISIDAEEEAFGI